MVQSSAVDVSHSKTPDGSNVVLDVTGLTRYRHRGRAHSTEHCINYYSALADGRDFKKALTKDGLLPNDAGYDVMGPLAEQAIAQALGRK